MHMVRHAAYAICMAMEILGNTIDISIKVELVVSGYGRFSPLCAKYNVII